MSLVRVAYFVLSTTNLEALKPSPRFHCRKAIPSVKAPGREERFGPWRLLAHASSQIGELSPYQTAHSKFGERDSLEEKCLWGAEGSVVAGEDKWCLHHTPRQRRNLKIEGSNTFHGITLHGVCETSR